MPGGIANVGSLLWEDLTESRTTVFVEGRHGFGLTSGDCHLRSAPDGVYHMLASSHITLRSSLDGTHTDVLTIIFNSNGTATITGPDGVTNGNVSVNSGTTQKYLVTVLQTGRISSQKKN